MLKGILDKLGIGRREAVLGGERLLCPNRGAIIRCDVTKRSQEFLPQRGRLLGLESTRPLAMYAVAAASSENDHGSMNLASNTASVRRSRRTAAQAAREKSLAGRTLWRGGIQEP